MAANNAFGHSELYPNLPFYTGTNVTTRATAGGYTANGSLGGAVSDTFVNYSGISTSVTLGVDAAKKLASAPYHMIALFDNFGDIGGAMRTSSDFGLSSSRGVVDLIVARQQGIPEDANQGIRSYPCGGTFDTNTALYNEVPNPIPGRDLSKNPIGQPIFFKGISGQAVRIVSVSMVDAQGKNVAMLPSIDKSNDSNNMLYNNETFALPAQPLTAYTKYTVTATLSVNGVTTPVPSFTFTTGAANSF